MSCLCTKKPCLKHKPDSQLMGFGASESFSLTDALTNPQAIIDKYKIEALKGVMIFAGTLLIGNYLMLHQALNQKIKKARSN